MKAIFPGKPQAKLQAVSTVQWEGYRIVAYISGSSLILLRGPNDLIQSISHGDSDHLEAVSISEASGKIAACTNSTIFIYKPYGLEEGDLKWSLQHSLTPKCGDTQLCSLSWGQPREVLAGGCSLTLIDTGARPHEIWTKELANPVKYASFTPDASFIASTGWRDRLAKIWRRSFLGEDEERFDVSYLAHPAAVTGIRWHRRPNQDYHCDTVLYTTCDDSRLRIWAATDHHGLQALQLWSELDLNEAIIPRQQPSSSERRRRYAFIMDGWEFEATVEHSLKRVGSNDRQAHTREHLMDVAYRNPDVCVVMDDYGNMSAWGLERVGCKARQPNDVFNIAIVEDLGLDWPKRDPPEQDLVCISDFGGSHDGIIHVLVHAFDGTVQWLKAPVDNLFDSSPSSSRFTVEAIWTGHSKALLDFATSTQKGLVLSKATDNQYVSWSQNTRLPTTLRRLGELKMPEEVHASCLLPHHQCVLFLHEAQLSIRRLRDGEMMCCAPCDAPKEGDQPILVFFSQSDEHFLVLLDAKCGSLWRLKLEERTGSYNGEWSLDFVGPLSGDIPDQEDTIAIPASGDQNRFACSVSRTGEVYSWTADVRTLLLRKDRTFATEICNPSLFALGKSGHVVIVDSSRMSFAIWSLHPLHLEYEQNFEKHETISCVELTSTADGHGMLAVAFAHRARIYVQTALAFHTDEACWTLARSIDFGNVTNLPVIACSWLVGDDLLFGAGNQMFVVDSLVEVPHAITSTLDVPASTVADVPISRSGLALNGSSPSFHPEVLLEHVTARQISHVDVLLSTLARTLKYWTPGDYLSSRIGLTSDRQRDTVGVTRHSLANGHTSDEDSIASTSHEQQDVFTQNAASDLVETLVKVDLPYISQEQQRRLSHIVTSVSWLEKHRKGLDEHGIIFQTHLRVRHENAATQQSPLSWQHIAWASHSTTQDVLVDLSTRLYQGRMLWKDARQCGLFMWLSDSEAVRAQFEIIARNEYTRTEEKNPIDCTLYYLALRKKQVLVGLWRMASWNREQRATMKMLANDFNDPKCKTTAMKNAYALLGLRRFEYAAAFFLLADRPKDAVGVLASQVGDIQLAIAVARVYEGDDGPILRELLQERILLQAAREGNRWLATWSFWLLGQKSKALCALLEPLEDLIPLESPPPPQSKHFTNTPPSLVHYYAMLRDVIRKTPGDSTTLLTPGDEHDLVMRSALCYVRAGSDYLALDLVRNWQYDKSAHPNTVWRIGKANGALTTPEDEAASEGEEEAPPSHEPAPTPLNATSQRKKITEEPSASSILDNFNF